MTRYWFDTEFIEDGRTIDLLSIGVVCEDGREFYAENIDADLDEANDWVKANVLPHLQGVMGNSVPGIVSGVPVEWWGWHDAAGVTLRHAAIGPALVEFVAVTPDPEFWAYYGDYDWVVLCQLFGRMIDLPAGWPMFAMDVKQLAVSLGNPRLPEQTSTEHNALADARWTKEAWEFLEHKDANVPPGVLP